MLDSTERERRRFARLLGLDGDGGCGLPVGDLDDRRAHRPNDPSAEIDS